MSKAYIVSRTGGTVTKAPVNDNKLPIYANETALDADLSNLEDGSIVATKGGHDDVIDQMKAYIRNQNVLSDWEDITIPTTSATAIEMQYDGFIGIKVTGNSYGFVFVDGVEVCGNSMFTSYSQAGLTFPFKKGQKIYINTSGSFSVHKVCYYKLRDYTGR